MIEMLAFAAVIAVAAYVVLGWAQSGNWFDRGWAAVSDAGSRVGQFKLWQLCLLVAGVAWVLGGPFSPLGNLLVVILAALIFSFGRSWSREFRFLMNLRDDALPGRNDKTIWALLLIVVPPVGVWTFRSYREAHWPEPEPANGKTAAAGEMA